MNTVTIHDNELRLNSGLDEAAFGKTTYFKLLSQEGQIFDGEKFTPWTFEQILTYPSEDKDTNDHVYYCGKNPLSKDAKTLLSYFEEYGSDADKKETLYKVVVSVVKAMTAAAEGETALPVVGAGGIIVDLKSDKVLFLPEDVFNYSTNPLPLEEYFRQQTAWINQTINGVPAICFERSVIVYRFLTDRFPYSSTDPAEHNSDILDKNFLPLAQCIEGLNLEFAKPINNGLRLNSTSVSVPGKRKKGVSSEDLKPETGFNFDLFDEAWQLRKTVNLSDEELTKKTQNYLAAQKTRIQTQRKLKRYFAAFMTASVVAFFVILLIFNTADKQNSTYTSKGLTSTEIVQGFFYGVNNKSTDLLNSLVTGDNPKEYVSKIQEVLLIDKQIAGFTSRGIYFNPTEWLFSIKDDDTFHAARAFGVTNVKIDDKTTELEIEVHRKNQKPEPVKIENNKPIEPNDTTTHTVDYYFVQTNPDTYDVIVEKERDIFTLTYKNNKWLITNIESEQEIIPVNTSKFEADYFGALEKFEGDQVAATESIRSLYEWLPSNESMLTQQSYLMYE